MGLRRVNTAGDILPHDLDSEQSVLGAILLNNETLVEIGEALREQDFYSVRHRRVFRAMLDVAATGRAIDLITLSNRLRLDGDLDAIGGPEALAAFENAVPTSINAVHWAKIVELMARAREVIGVCSGAATALAAGSILSLEEDIANIADQVFSLTLSRADAGDSAPWADDAEAAQVEIENLFQNGTSRGAPTGFRHLDECWGGWVPGKLVTVGGDSSHGKTAFALQAAKNLARAGYPVIFGSTEMSQRELQIRILSDYTEIENMRLANPSRLTPNLIAKCRAAMTQVAALPICVIDCGGMDFAAFLRRAKITIRRSRALFPSAPQAPALVIGDFFQDFGHNDGGHESLADRMGQSAKAAKEFAKAQKCAVLLTAQLKKGARDEKTPPSLGDLYGTGGLEKSSDVVALIHWPWRHAYRRDPDAATKYNPADFYLHTEKNRSGAIGATKLCYDRQIGRIVDWRDDAPDALEQPDIPFDED